MTQAELLDKLFAEFIPRTKDDALLLLQEGHFKCEVIRDLLNVGCTVQESSPKQGKAYFLSETQGGLGLAVSEQALILKPVDGSCDTAVTAPIQCMFEFKVRPNMGSNSKADHKAIEKDLDKVCADECVVALFGFEDHIYKSFSGSKNENRGRPSDSPCRNMLLPLESATTGATSLLQWKTQNLSVRYYRQEATSKVTRVFVAIIQQGRQ
jgi:hypothetical protein